VQGQARVGAEALAQDVGELVPVAPLAAQDVDRDLGEVGLVGVAVDGDRGPAPGDRRLLRPVEVEVGDLAHGRQLELAPGVQVQCPLDVVVAGVELQEAWGKSQEGAVVADISR